MPWSIEDYAPAFEKAARQGLGRTVHAGEGQPASQIKTAIELLGAQRIGHGCSLLDDPDLLELVLAKGVTIEACPTSNTHTDVFDSIDQHPLPRWLSLGVRACICTDNTLLSQVNAPQEYARAASIPGMTPKLMELATRWGHEGAFRP